MAHPAKRRATYEDLLGVPDNLVGEIVDGELITSPRPTSRHGRATTELGADLVGPFGRGTGGPGGWIILFEPELHLRADVLVPDLAGWRRERMPEMPDTAAFTQAPDWVCEVLSPSTAALDRAHKMPIYAREGVLHVWLIDPAPRTLEVMRLEGAGWFVVSVHEGDCRVRPVPFEAIELDLARLWSR